MADVKERLRGLGCLAIVAVIVFFGAQSALVALRERAPTKLTMAEFSRARPDKKWLELGDVKLDVINAISLSGLTGTIKEIFIPLQPRGAPKGTPATLIVATKDPTLLNAFYTLKNAGDDAAKGLTALGDALAQAEKVTSVSGLIQTGLDDGSSHDKVRRELGPGAIPDCPIMVQDEKPSLGVGLVMTIGGCLFAALLVIGMLTPDKKDERALRQTD